MKSIKNLYPFLLACLFGFALILTTTACNQKKSSSETTGFEEKPISDAPVQPVVKDTSTVATPSTPSEPSKVYPKPTPKTCQPNFTMIGKPKGNHYLFYVTGFNPGEFKCWGELEAHGVEISKGRPCVIYYVDTPNASMTAIPPDYVDKKVLMEHGLGQFAHDEHWREVKGAKLWGRSGAEFTYFNTNNNAGG